MDNLVSVTKNRSTTLPSGVVDTFTFFMVSSSSKRTSVTSVTNHNHKHIQFILSTQSNTQKALSRYINIPKKNDNSR